MAASTDTDTQDFSPSASFRATMEAVTGGERDQGKLRETAAEKTAERLARDPIPGDDRPAKDPVPEPTPDPKPEDDPEHVEELPGKGDDKDDKDDKGKPPADDPEKPDGDEPEKPADTEEKPAEGTPESRAEARRKLTEKGDEKPEDDLRGEMPSDPIRFRKRVKNYEALLTERDTVIESTKKQLEELQTKVKDFEEKGAGVPPDVKEQLSELRQYRRRYAIEKDPEFHQRFSARIEESNELVDDALKSINVSERLRGEIKKVGGIGAFIRSDITIPIKGANGKVEKVDARKFIALALDTAKSTAPDAEAVLHAELASQRRLEAEKTKFIEKEVAEADKYFEELSEKERASSISEEQHEEQLNKVVDHFKATVHQSDWLKDLEVPEDPAEAKGIREENVYRRKLRSFFDMQLQMPMVREAAKRATKQEHLDEFANMLIDATRVFHVERELDSAKAEVKELKAELDKVRKAASRTTSRRTPGRDVVDTSGEPKRSDFPSDLQFSIAHNRWEEAQGKK